MSFSYFFPLPDFIAINARVQDYSQRYSSGGNSEQLGGAVVSTHHEHFWTTELVEREFS